MNLYIRRKAFISYFEGDIEEVTDFVDRFGPDGQDVFIPRMLDVSSDEDLVESTNPDYVMSQIRQRYLTDSTVTIVLLGRCTHSRRFVDWELKSSLRSGETYIPNGVLGVVLPSAGQVHLPLRLQENVQSRYAKIFPYPAGPQKLGEWIEDAYDARESRWGDIVNSSDMMRYNARCLAHGVTH